MGRNGKRSIYDPTIVSRLADEHNASPTASDDDNELYFTDENGGGGGRRTDAYDVGYMTEEAGERQLTSEILDPKLHGHAGVRTRAQQAKARRRRCLLVTSLLVVLAVVVAVICGVAVQKSKSSSSSRSSPSPVQPNPNGKDHAQLPAPPSNLNALCTGTVELAGGAVDASDLAGCQAACQPAECCEIPSQFQSSCLRGNEDVCMKYHQECFVLEMGTYGSNDVNPFVVHQSNVTVEPAPVDLAQTCSMNRLTTNGGTVACANECQPYECCYSTEVASCADQELCAGYSPCMNLRAHATVDDSIQNEVDALCQFDKLIKSVDNRQQCNNACKLARCCFGDNACFSKPEGFCKQYNSCKNLYGKKGQELKDIDNATYDDQYDDDDGTYDGDDNTYYDDDGAQSLDDNAYMDDTQMVDNTVQGTAAEGWDVDGQDDTYDDNYDDDDQYDDTVANRR